MPTNEERREVAEDLRTIAAYRCRYAEQFYELLQEIVMDSWDFHGFQDVANRLADLIEPEPERTCWKVKKNDPTGKGNWNFHCSRCNHYLRGTDEYCSECGAKVVE